MGRHKRPPAYVWMIHAIGTKAAEIADWLRWRIGLRLSLWVERQHGWTRCETCFGWRYKGRHLINYGRVGKRRITRRTEWCPSVCVRWSEVDQKRRGYS